MQYLLDRMSLGLKKQPTVSESSIKVEYRVIAHTAAENVWICKLLLDLGIILTFSAKVYCDNVGARYLITNPIHRQHSKHIILDYHFVRKHVAKTTWSLGMYLITFN